MPSPTPDRPVRTPDGTAGAARTTIAVLLVLLLGGLLGGLAGCSGETAPEDGPAAGTGTGGAAEDGPPPLATTVRVGKVVGRTLPRARTSAARSVARVVDGWVDAAYVGGSWPREDFPGAFRGFTRGARTLALDDARLMSNAGIGHRVDGVRARQRRVVVDLLADRRRRPVAATARVRLTFRTTGGIQETFRVRGRLLLTRTRAGWRVFGYDITKGSR